MNYLLLPLLLPTPAAATATLCGLHLQRRMMQ